MRGCRFSCAGVYFQVHFHEQTRAYTKTISTVSTPIGIQQLDAVHVEFRESGKDARITFDYTVYRVFP